MRDGVGLEHPFRRQQNPATLRLVVHEPYAARQTRPGAWSNGSSLHHGPRLNTAMAAVLYNKENIRNAL